ncbi:MAG: diacylglycerol kinase family protein [Myxococcota bacterium]|nr:diacylglycerol kinase family protein [Myxococcota bacterium]
MSESFSASRRVASFGFAIRGVALMLKSQHNAWIHAAVSIATCAVGFWLGLSTTEWCWIVVAMVVVWTAESINTALERLADAVTTDHHPLIGQAKDAAAGAVLIAAVGAATIGLLVMGPHLLAKF